MSALSKKFANEYVFCDLYNDTGTLVNKEEYAEIPRIFFSPEQLALAEQEIKNRLLTKPNSLNKLNDTNMNNIERSVGEFRTGVDKEANVEDYKEGAITSERIRGCQTLAELYALCRDDSTSKTEQLSSTYMIDGIRSGIKNKNLDPETKNLINGRIWELGQIASKAETIKEIESSNTVDELYANMRVDGTVAIPITGDRRVDRMATIAEIRAAANRIKETDFNKSIAITNKLIELLRSK